MSRGERTDAFPAEPAGSTGTDLSLGVEEEFFLVDAATGRPAPRSPEVVAVAASRLGDRVKEELTPQQIELVTPVCADIEDVAAQVAAGRSALTRAANESGCRLLAAGTPVLGPLGPPPLSDGDRRMRMGRHFGPVLAGQGTCALHVHIGVEDRRRAVLAMNHIRPFLPQFLALAVNSPYADGRATGHHSWRSVVASRWPTIGPPPVLHSEREFHRFAETARECGLSVKTSGIYWWLRPSFHLPTLELRIGDSQRDVEVVLLVAALAQALVGWALARVDAGRSYPPVDSEAIRAAVWAVGRTGLTGVGIDVRTGRKRPVTQLVGELHHMLRPDLERLGTWSLSTDLLARLVRDGTGAQRQQDAVARTGMLEAALTAMLV